MEDLASKSSQPVELVSDSFSGKFTTAKAHLKLPQHRCFVGCKVGAECLAIRTEALVEKYARRVLNEKSDISCTGEIVDVCKIVVRALDGLRAIKRMISWKGPDGLHPVQMFPLHFTYFLANLTVDQSSSEKKRNIPLH